MAPYSLVSLWEMMIELPIGRLLHDAHRMSILSQQVVNAAEENKPMGIPSSAHAHLVNCAADLQMCCREIGLTTTDNMAHDLMVVMHAAQSDGDSKIFSAQLVKSLRNCVMALNVCLEKESLSRRALVLPPEMVWLYEPKVPHLGDEVRNKFSKCSYEIDEAAKCLALGRSTASVFHLMRMLEVALGAVYQCLGLPPMDKKDRSWGNVLGKIDIECKRREVWKEQEFFRDIHERLNAIRHAQRNSTMHVESIYTPEDAKLVFDNTKLFMVKLASRMDQDGQPLA